MATLENKIELAKTTKDLENIVESIKRQQNGFKNQLSQHLGDTFWYEDLTDNIVKQKEFMFKICKIYPSTQKVLN